MLWKTGEVKRPHYCLRSLRGITLKLTKNDWRYSSLVFPCALNGGPCTCRQRKHVQKHTTAPFHEIPDWGFIMTMGKLKPKPEGLIFPYCVSIFVFKKIITLKIFLHSCQYERGCAVLVRLTFIISKDVQC